MRTERVGAARPAPARARSRWSAAQIGTNRSAEGPGSRTPAPARRAPRRPATRSSRSTDPLPPLLRTCAIAPPGICSAGAMMSGSPMAIHRYGARQLDAVEHDRAARARERAARRDALVVELDRLRPGVAHLLEHVEHRERLDEPVGLREGDDHPGPLGRKPAREDPLRLGAAPQRVERRLATVRAGEQVVALPREVGRLPRERVAAVRGLVEDADEVALPHPGEVRLARTAGPARPARSPRTAHRTPATICARVARGWSARPRTAQPLGGSAASGLDAPARRRPRRPAVRRLRSRSPCSSGRRTLGRPGHGRPVGSTRSGSSGRGAGVDSSGTARPARPVGASVGSSGTTGGSGVRLVGLGLVRHDRRQGVRLVGLGLVRHDRWQGVRRRARPARRAAGSCVGRARPARPAAASSPRRLRLVRHDRGQRVRRLRLVRHDGRQGVGLVGGRPTGPARPGRPAGCTVTP